MWLAQAADSGSSANSYLTFVPLILIAAVFYFALIRPQRNRMKRQRQLAQAVVVGDRVQTYGGVRGVVAEAQDEFVVLKVREGRIEVARSAIASKLE